MNSCFVCSRTSVFEMDPSDLNQEGVVLHQEKPAIA
jgi:hypothetical protein